VTSQSLSSQRYHLSLIAFHWLTLFLLVAIYALMEFKGIYDKGSAPRELMKSWHFILGLTLLLVTVARLVARTTFPAPAITPTPPLWQLRLAKVVHLALYLFLLVMPLLGWSTLSAAGKPIPFWGLHLPALLMPDEALARNLKEIHEILGRLGYGLIGLHAVAAIYHHHFMRDDTLLRIVPERCRQRLQK